MNIDNFENKWADKNQWDVQQQHIRIRWDGVEGMSDEKVIFANENRLFSIS